MGLGYNSLVKVGGTSTAFLAAATTVLPVDGLGRARRQITDAPKRVLDPQVAIVIKDDGVPVAAADIAGINYVFGIITFVVGYVFTGDITVDASYIPTLVVAEARSDTIRRSRQMLETTSYQSAQANSAARSHVAGLREASVDVEVLDVGDTDWDPGPGTVTGTDLLDNDTDVLLEVRISDSGYFFRGWGKLTGLEASVSVADLAKTTLKWQASAVPGNGRPYNAMFGVGQ